MPNSGEFRQFPAEYSETKTRCPGVGAGIRQTPVGSADTRVPLLNLSTLRLRMDSLHRFLSASVNRNTLIGKDQMDMVSTEIVSAIHQIIVNGAALLACTQNPNLEAQAAESTCPMASDPNCSISGKSPITDPKPKQLVDPKVEVTEEESEECEIIELDSMELLAEHIHLCDICGKGFKRDANLRMHMRAHGNQYKTAEALAKPDRCSGVSRRRARFSCPYVGCNRNKFHKKFRPLKSVICVKNHFKRSHCPKMYSCNRCNKKSFSVVADLKSHLKHCGDSKWRCSCGTSFSRKDKLFGHMALFEGHMPAVAQDDEKSKGGAAAAAASSAMMEEDEDNGLFLDGLLEGFGSIDSYCLQDVLTSPHPGLDTGMEDFYDDF